MVNFSPKLEESSEEQLNSYINNSSPHFGSLASDELSRREFKELRIAIKNSDKTTRRFSMVILFVGFLQLLVIVAQLVLAAATAATAANLAIGICTIIVLGIVSLVFVRSWDKLFDQVIKEKDIKS